MPRRKVKVKATELEDVDVNFISIVDRGANRIPFRIMKQENSDMIDLGSIFALRKQEKTPAVVGFLVNDDREHVSQALVDAGYDFVETTKDDTGVSIHKMEGYSDTGTAVIKMSEDLAVVVDLQKGMITYPDSSSFSENVKKSGFFPGMTVATDILMETMFNVMSEEGGPEDTVAKIESAVTDYASYVVSLAKAVPTSAFKMESPEFKETLKGMLLNPTVPAEGGEETDAAEETSSEATEAEGGNTPDGDADPQPETTEPEATEEEPASEESDEGSAEGSDGAPEAEATEEVQKSQDTDELLRKLDAMFSGQTTAIRDEILHKVDSVITQVSDMGEKLTQFEERVASVEEVAKSADEAVRGTALTGGPGDDGLGMRAARKDDTGTGLFDSALSFDGYER